MKRPFVSAVIPAYNRAHLLGEAIASALEQGYAPLEIIVVDDGSTDATGDVARSFTGVRVIRQENQGVAAARNAGIAASRGELIAFLDSDDTWTRDKLRVQVGHHENHPEVGYSVTHLRNVLAPGVACPKWLPPRFLEGTHVGMATCTLMVRRDVFDRVGVFDPKFRVAEDTDWLCRAKDAGVPMAIIPEALLTRLVHQQNLSGLEAHNPEVWLRIMKASFDRKRAARAAAVGASA